MKPLSNYADPLFFARLSRLRKSLIGVLTVSFLCSFLPIRAQAAQGDLDPGFGNGGKVTTLFGGGDSVFAIATEPGGKIIAVGSASNRDFAIARYDNDGSLDPGFGSGGKVTTDFFGNTDVALAVALQPDGKIIAAGRTRVAGTNFELFDFAVARYNADGSLDSTFGSGGKVTTDFTGGFDIAHAIAIQPNGKIVVAGWARNSATGGLDFGVARYNPNGSLDTGYGSGGKLSTDFFGDTDTAFAAAIQSDGKILVAGLSVVDSISRFAIARYEVSKPRIISASASGKRLTVSGEDFDAGAVILVNGKEQSTTNDPQTPNMILLSKKGAKKIRPGATVLIQIRNGDGALSQEFSFTRTAI